MLFLAKFAGIAILVWFYLTAKDKGEPAFKWAIIGVIGYWIAWWLVNLTVVSAVAGMVAKNLYMLFLVNQIPALCAIVAAALIKKKLLADAVNNHQQAEE